MKIYDEITIDMNPESETYEQVLSEDSYNYEGEVHECKKAWNKVRKGWRKLTSNVGKIWKAVVKKPLKWLDKKLLDGKGSKFLRKHVPSWIRNMKSADWFNVALSIWGPGAVFGKLGSMIGKAGQWGTKLAGNLSKGLGMFGKGNFLTGGLGKFAGKALTGVNNIVNTGLSLGQSAVGMGKASAFAGGTGKFGNFLGKVADVGAKVGGGAWNPLGTAFKATMGGLDALRGMAGGGVDWAAHLGKGEQWLKPLIESGGKIAQFGGREMQTGTDGYSSYDVQPQSWGDAYSQHRADNFINKGIGRALDAGQNAMQAGNVLAPAMFDWAGTNPHSGLWSNAALGTAELGGELAHQLAPDTFGEEYSYKSGPNDTSTEGGGINVGESGDLQWGTAPGDDVVFDAAQDAGAALDAISSEAQQKAAAGYSDVSGIANKYQELLPNLRNTLYDKTFGQGYDPNTILSISGQEENPLADTVGEAARAKGYGVETELNKLKTQWDDLMYNPDYGMDDFSYWDEAHGSKPTWG